MKNNICNDCGNDNFSHDEYCTGCGSHLTASNHSHNRSSITFDFVNYWM